MPNPLARPRRVAHTPEITNYSTADYRANMPNWQSAGLHSLMQEYLSQPNSWTQFRGPRVSGENQFHSTFQRTLGDLEDAAATKDNFRMARDSIRKSADNRAHSYVDPLLEKALANPRGYIENYMETITKPMMETMRKESQKNLDELLPNVDRSFATRGGFYSGARYNARDKTRKHALEALEGNQKKLEAQALHKAHEFAEGHATRHLQAADIQRGLSHEQSLENVAAANAASQLQGQKQATRHQELSALSQEAARKQLLGQAEIDEKVKEHNAQTQHDREMARQDVAVMAGLPSTASAGYANAVVPSPHRPNPYSQAGGILAQNVGMQGLQSHKKGGSVMHKIAADHYAHKKSPISYREMCKLHKANNHKDHFADGGSLAGQMLPMLAGAPTLDQVKHTPETHEMAHLAKRMGQDLNPQAMLLARMGSAIGANPHNDPLVAGAMGFDEGLNDYQNIHNNNAVNQARAATAYKAIQDSRQGQHSILMKYQAHQQELAEQKRIHDSQIGLYNAHANYYNAGANAKQLPPLKLGKEDRKILEDYAQIQQSSPELLHELNTMERLAPKITTGEWAGHLPVSTPGIGSSADIEEFNKSGNKLVMAGAQNLKGRTGIGMATMIEKGKPNRYISPEGNIRNIKSSKKVIEDKLKVGEFISEALEAGIAPTKALAAYSKYERLKHKNPNINPYELLGIKDKEWDDNEEVMHEVGEHPAEKGHKAKSVENHEEDDDYTDAEVMAALK